VEGFVEGGCVCVCAEGERVEDFVILADAYGGRVCQTC